MRRWASGPTPPCFDEKKKKTQKESREFLKDRSDVRSCIPCCVHLKPRRIWLEDKMRLRLFETRATKTNALRVSVINSLLCSSASNLMPTSSLLAGLRYQAAHATFLHRPPARPRHPLTSGSAHITPTTDLQARSLIPRPVKPL